LKNQLKKILLIGQGYDDQTNNHKAQQEGCPMARHASLFSQLIALFTLLLQGTRRISLVHMKSFDCMLAVRTPEAHQDTRQKRKAFKPIQITEIQKAREIEARYISKLDRPKIRTALKNCLKKLTKRQRQVFGHKIKGKTQREIARKLKVTEGNITQILQHASKRFSRCMASYGFNKEDIFE
jgi:RNA polymerase sigma factor (sigma-70 family)